MPMMRRTHYAAHTAKRKARQCLFLKSEFNYGIKEFRALKRAIEAGELDPAYGVEQKTLFLQTLRQDRTRAARFGCKWAIRASVPLGRARWQRR
jgi:hypothetical protein